MRPNLFVQSSVIREPVANEPGYWVGAPGALYNADEKAWYLTYRIRRPRGWLLIAAEKLASRDLLI